MKLLHIADLHIGKTLNGFSLLEDQRYALAECLAIAKDNHVDALLLAGDLYDKTTPSAEAVALLDWFFDQVLDTGIPCFAIPGNHDSAERVAYAQGPLARERIFVAPRFDGTLEPITLEDRHGQVAFWLLPFLKPANVRPFYPDATIGTDYTAAISAVLEANPPDTSLRNVLLCHQFAVSGGEEPLRSDSELQAGGLDAVDASIFDAYDYVALGHIHRPQSVGRKTMRYAGSLLKYSASEADFPKSAVLIDLGPKSDPPGIELVPIEPLHDMRRIKGPLEELLADEVSYAADAQDYLHVTLTDVTPRIDALARLRSVYPNVMSLEYERKSTDRARKANARCTPDPAAAHMPDTLKLFEEFFEQQAGIPLTSQQRSLAEETLARHRQHSVSRSNEQRFTDAGKESL